MVCGTYDKLWERLGRGKVKPYQLSLSDVAGRLNVCTETWSCIQAARNLLAFRIDATVWGPFSGARWLN